MWPKYRSRNETERQRERERESALVKLESIYPVSFKASVLSSFLWFCEPVLFLLNLERIAPSTNDEMIFPLPTDHCFALHARFLRNPECFLGDKSIVSRVRFSY